eukprot:TRINITY_DN5802_c0_g3_i2.p1 TRINITY_DN5802_c0_g3~~TRINITY_DN5802_c0_g3_i2.p1  ORF type:complete len:401 (+),score=105.52 TRINITY_DN5802_c0_g3_i2:75-1277(+)
MSKRTKAVNTHEAPAAAADHEDDEPKGSTRSRVLCAGFCFLLSVPVALVAIACGTLQVPPAVAIVGGLIKGLEAVHTRNPAWDPTPISVQAKAWNTVFKTFSPLQITLNKTEDTIFWWRTVSTVLAAGVPDDPRCTAQDSVVAEVPIKTVWKKKGASWSEPAGRVFYLHGGGFVFGDFGTYKSFLCKLAHRTNYEIVYIDYPLAPDSGTTIKTQVKSVVSVISTMGYDAKRTLIVGDSAGGNLALLAARRLYFDGLPTVAGLGLISPFIDFVPEHLSNYQNKDTDYMLSLQTLRVMVLAALGSDTSLVRSECCNGFCFSWSRFPPIVVSASTAELLYGDALQTCEKAKKHNVPCDLVEGDNMLHIWLVADGYVPESTAATDTFVAKLLRHTENAPQTNAS